MATKSEFWTERLRALGTHIQEEFPGLGFLVMVFPFGEAPEHQNRLNYISNAQRGDVMKLLMEFLAKNYQGSIEEFNTDFLQYLNTKNKKP